MIFCDRPPGGTWKWSGVHEASPSGQRMVLRLDGDGALTRALSGLPVREPLDAETAERDIRIFAQVMALDVGIPVTVDLLRRLADELADRDHCLPLQR